MINLLLIGVCMYFFAWNYDWGWTFCFMFGSILAATDPVAVVAVLKELGASKRLSTLIEAESLLNDGTAFVFFEIFRKFASNPSNTTFGSVIADFAQLAIGGVVCGIVFGWITYRALSVVFSNFQIEITFTLCMCYLSFYFAEHVLGASGVLTVVFMGLWVSKNKQAISPVDEETVHHFWEMAGFILNTILFFITGQVITYRVYNDSSSYSWRDGVILFILYIMCHIIRGIAVAVLFPLLRKIGYGITWHDCSVIVYGGLRGAIGLALALIVDDTAFSHSDESVQELNKDRVLFHVCGIVFLSLTINATTVKYLVNGLELNKPPKSTASLFKSSTDYMTDDTYEKLSNMKLNKHYKGANWDIVCKMQPNYGKLYEKTFGQWEFEKSRTESRTIHSKKALDTRVIQVMKSSYWTQYEKGLIADDMVVYILVEAADEAIDESNINVHSKVLEKYFKIPKYIKKMHVYKGGWLAKITKFESLVRYCGAKLLFNNLSVCVEIADAFLYGAQRANHFGKILIRHEAVFSQHIKAALAQLDNVSTFIKLQLTKVEDTYPEVHQAVQTLHATRALLHHQKHEIEKLARYGLFDESEQSKIFEIWDNASQRLFYTKLTCSRHDALLDKDIFLHSILCDQLLEKEQLAIQKASSRATYDKNTTIIEAGRRYKDIFVITRGTISVFENVKYKYQKKSRTLTNLEYTSGVDIHQMTPIYVKQPLECIDTYPILTNTKHGHSFVVSSEVCHGFWVSTDQLGNNDISVNLWDTLWKTAALDVIRYYYRDADVFTDTINIFDDSICNLEQFIMDSPLVVYEPSKPFDMSSYALTRPKEKKLKSNDSSSSISSSSNSSSDSISNSNSNGEDEIKEELQHGASGSGSSSSDQSIHVPNGAYLLLLHGTLVNVDNASKIIESPAIVTSQASFYYITVEKCVGLVLNLQKFYEKVATMDPENDDKNVDLTHLLGVDEDTNLQAQTSAHTPHASLSEMHKQNHKQKKHKHKHKPKHKHKHKQKHQPLKGKKKTKMKNIKSKAITANDENENENEEENMNGQKRLIDGVYAHQNIIPEVTTEASFGSSFGSTSVSSSLDTVSISISSESDTDGDNFGMKELQKSRQTMKGGKIVNLDFNETIDDEDEDDNKQQTFTFPELDTTTTIAGKGKEKEFQSPPAPTAATDNINVNVQEEEKNDEAIPQQQRQPPILVPQATLSDEREEEQDTEVPPTPTPTVSTVCVTSAPPPPAKIGRIDTPIDGPRGIIPRIASVGGVVDELDITGAGGGGDFDAINRMKSPTDSTATATGTGTGTGTTTITTTIALKRADSSVGKMRKNEADENIDGKRGVGNNNNNFNREFLSPSDLPPIGNMDIGSKTRAVSEVNYSKELELKLEMEGVKPREIKRHRSAEVESRQHPGLKFFPKKPSIIELRSEILPDKLTIGEWSKMDKIQSFEMIKHILTKYSDLYEKIRHFQVEHIRYESKLQALEKEHARKIKKRRKKKQYQKLRQMHTLQLNSHQEAGAGAGTGAGGCSINVQRGQQEQQQVEKHKGKNHRHRRRHRHRRKHKHLDADVNWDDGKATVPMLAIQSSQTPRVESLRHKRKEKASNKQNLTSYKHKNTQKRQQEKEKEKEKQNQKRKCNISSLGVSRTNPNYENSNENSNSNEFRYTDDDDDDIRNLIDEIGCKGGLRAHRSDGAIDGTPAAHSISNKSNKSNKSSKSNRSNKIDWVYPFDNANRKTSRNDTIDSDNNNNEDSIDFQGLKNDQNKNNNNNNKNNNNGKKNNDNQRETSASLTVSRLGSVGAALGFGNFGKGMGIGKDDGGDSIGINITRTASSRDRSLLRKNRFLTSQLDLDPNIANKVTIPPSGAGGVGGIGGIGAIHGGGGIHGGSGLTQRVASQKNLFSQVSTHVIPIDVPKCKAISDVQRIDPKEKVNEKKEKKKEKEKEKERKLTAQKVISGDCHIQHTETLPFMKSGNLS